MAKEHLELIQSIIGVEEYEKNKKLQPPTPKELAKRPLVTVSRSYGANGTDIARRLAKELEVPLYDGELLKAVVKEAKEDKFLLEALDERATSLMDDLLHGFFSKKSTTKSAFFRYMGKVILSISAQGGVIVGRGAHLLIPENRPVLRVRLEGSDEVCIKRLAKRLDIKKSEAARRMRQVNEERAEFVKTVFKKHPTNQLQFDLILNTDTFDEAAAVKVILAAAKQVGLVVPKSK
ncbi:MAG: cytidylate kinase-like family protein [Magnetococcales bacterium]|nr:cytidylate kinase-like family protein [Magnetococcales bacterium]